ncbi:MAG: hypothetical protein P9M07_02920 [Candidatus Aceula meridiana]|nr:hypothetical protein [Candidatus Aceula meridiana]
MNQEFDNVVETIYAKDTRYSHEAYEFLMEALNFTQKKFRRSKHVSGEELLKGAQELLQEKFGLMTLTVLEHWGIKTTEDFGNMVFNLVEHKILSKTDEDSIKDFKDGYDFQKVFGHGYRKRFEKQVSRIRNF